jgi:hypothetical protein
MLTEYEASVLTKRRQEVGRTHLRDGQMSVAQIDRAMQQAHKLRSSHLRGLLGRDHSSTPWPCPSCHLHFVCRGPVL